MSRLYVSDFEKSVHTVMTELLTDKRGEDYLSRYFDFGAKERKTDKGPTRLVFRAVRSTGWLKVTIVLNQGNTMAVNIKVTQQGDLLPDSKHILALRHFLVAMFTRRGILQLEEKRARA